MLTVYGHDPQMHPAKNPRIRNLALNPHSSNTWQYRSTKLSKALEVFKKTDTESQRDFKAPAAQSKGFALLLTTQGQGIGYLLMKI
jgi:hypothetical protein